MNMPLSGRRKSDGPPATVTLDLRKLGWLLVTTILIPLVVWGAKSYDASKLDASRFVADSSRNELRWVVRDSVLLRIDRRTKAMFCQGKPVGCE